MHCLKIDYWTICDTLLHMLGCAIQQYLHNYLNKTSRIKQLSLKKRQMLEKLGGVRESRGLSFSSAKPYSLVQRTFHPCHSIKALHQQPHYFDLGIMAPCFMHYYRLRASSTINHTCLDEESHSLLFVFVTFLMPSFMA